MLNQSHPVQTVSTTPFIKPSSQRNTTRWLSSHHCSDDTEHLDCIVFLFHTTSRDACRIPSHLENALTIPPRRYKPRPLGLLLLPSSSHNIPRHLSHLVHSQSHFTTPYHCTATQAQSTSNTTIPKHTQPHHLTSPNNITIMSSNARASRADNETFLMAVMEHNAGTSKASYPHIPKP